MKIHNYLITTVVIVFILSLTLCAKKEKEESFVSLFDGKMLNSWKIPEGDNGHWKIIDGVIDYDGKSEAPGDKNLWSEKEYKDFVLKVDWRLTKHPGEEQA